MKWYLPVLVLLPSLAALPFDRAAIADCGIPPVPPYSMGQPHRVHLSVSPLAGYDFEREERIARLSVDLDGEARVPQIGLANLTLEGAAGWSGENLDYGGALLLKVPWIRAGVEYNSLDEDYVFVLSSEVALRRGGLFGRGDEFRIDYRPARQEVYAGLTFHHPFSRYRMTRPRAIYTRLPKGKSPKPSFAEDFEGLSPEMDAAVSRVERAVEWMDRLLTPHFESGLHFEETVAAYREHLEAPGGTFAEEDAAYHRELSHAFTLVADRDAARGDEFARTAESILLHQVVAPFDRLFCQNKKPHDTAGFLQVALREFDSYLAGESVFPETDPVELARRRAQAREIFRRTLVAIDRAARAGRERWKQPALFWLTQSRTVWLPVNYGLRPEQYDTQEEWDAIVELFTGSSVSSANRIAYLLNEQFHRELKRMIGETRSYHVLHIHDFRGRFGRNETDRIGWDLIVDGYLTAFRNAVREIDAGEREELPQFLILIDENYYQENRSRQVMTFLEHLYTADPVDLTDDVWESRVRAAHQALLDAVGSSPSFRTLDKECLEGLFKIHVSVTNPFDPAFGADVAMRDHRKLAFRDVFEDDPASGEAVFTGEGVGEHYNGPSWEDRSILVQGTALEGLKTSTRELLRSQGYRDEEIPGYLRARPRSESHDRQCQEMIDAGWNTPVLLARNETGYGDKQSSVLKALTYNLTPVGGFLISFDSLWISEYWAGMFLAAALRGAHVYVVAPTSRNAPSSALPTMVLLRENLNRMRKASDRLQVEIERAGGSFHVGLYAQTVSVDDLQGNVRSFLEGYRRYPFLQRELGLHPSVLEVLDELVAAGADPTDRADPGDSRIEIERKHDPFLHLKTQFLASDEAFEAVQLPEWASVTRAYLRTRDRQLHGSGRERVTPDLLGVSPGSGGNGPSLSEALDGRLAIRGAAAPDRRVSSWLVGSQNQDRRGMLSDGEIMVAVSGPAALTAMVDLILLLGSATWPTAEPEFDAVFPPFEGPPFLERAFRVIKDAI